MSAPAVTVLSVLAEGIVSAALDEGDEGGMRALVVGLERCRGAGALGALAPWRRERTTGADHAAVVILKRLDRDLVLGFGELV